VRERGVQARRARAAGGRPPPRSGRLRFWQALAVVALLAATAGWTTVAVIALRPAPAAEALASPTPAAATEAPVPTEDASVPPPVLSHAVANLETLLPAELNGTSLTRESWTGATFLGDDPWSVAVTTFLTGAGKTPADLEASQAYDQLGGLDLSAGAFRVAGVDPKSLLDAILASWKENYPDLKTTQASVGGLDVTTGDFGQGGGTTSYWYLHDGVVFDIETSDPVIAQAALAALPTAGASSVPSSGAPASPSATGSRAPSASPSPS
jgi:hypothetical protein